MPGAHQSQAPAAVGLPKAGGGGGTRWPVFVAIAYRRIDRVI